jgi:DNA repair protein RadC
MSSIKAWAEDDRPREKLLRKGRSALSNAELLAIILGSGSTKESAVDLAKRILAFVKNDLAALSRLSVEDLCKFKGVGPAKAISIITTLELGNRRRLAGASVQNKINSSKIAFELLQPRIGDLSVEEFWVIYLANNNRPIDTECISKGGMAGTVVDTRVVFKRALEKQATGLILAHNHPSGGLVPSQADRVLTKRFVEAGKVMDIQVLDHLIVTEHNYYSFADEGLI